MHHYISTLFCSYSHFWSNSSFGSVFYYNYIHWISFSTVGKEILRFDFRVRFNILSLLLDIRKIGIRDINKSIVSIDFLIRFSLINSINFSWNSWFHFDNTFPWTLAFLNYPTFWTIKSFKIYRAHAFWLVTRLRPSKRMITSWLVERIISFNVDISRAFLWILVMRGILSTWVHVLWFHFVQWFSIYFGHKISYLFVFFLFLMLKQSLPVHFSSFSIFFHLSHKIISNIVWAFWLLTYSLSTYIRQWWLLRRLKLSTTLLLLNFNFYFLLKPFSFNAIFGLLTFHYKSTIYFFSFSFTNFSMWCTRSRSWFWTVHWVIEIRSSQYFLRSVSHFIFFLSSWLSFMIQTIKYVVSLFSWATTFHKTLKSTFSFFY